MTELPSVDALISEGTTRLRNAVPASGPHSILLSIGAGERAAEVATALRRALEENPRIVFASVTSVPGPPVADEGTPGGHVNTVETRVDPPPQVVVRISEADGRVYLAARLPGSDPLGPPTNGWLWALSAR
jgi:hypothetical protein